MTDIFKQLQGSDTSPIFIFAKWHVQSLHRCNTPWTKNTTLKTQKNSDVSFSMFISMFCVFFLISKPTFAKYIRVTSWVTILNPFKRFCQKNVSAPPNTTNRSSPRRVMGIKVITQVQRNKMSPNTAMQYTRAEKWPEVPWHLRKKKKKHWEGRETKTMINPW